MSKIALSGPASGTATYTISAPTGATDRTITLPDQTATLITNSSGVLDIGSGQLYKDASGNVGIGTSSPSSKFQVAGDVRINTVGTATTGLPIYAKQTNNDQRGIWTESATTDSNGRFYCDNSVVGIAASYSSTGSYLPITFTTSATERARIDSSGRFLVGKTTNGDYVTGVEMQPAGAVLSYRTSGVAGIFGRTDNGETVRFTNNGNGVGNISTTGSATAYNTSSDYRLKHDIAPMTGALAKVQALNPVTYKWNADNSESQGFIAHELQAVVPDCVTGEKDAVDADGNPVYQGIDTSFLVATLTAAIQEQQAIITALTARVTALEGTQP